jgi:hypothetical protein
LLHQGFAFAQHLGNRRNDPLTDHAQHDQEDDQDDEEGAVGDQEVAGAATTFLSRQKDDVRVSHGGH